MKKIICFAIVVLLGFSKLQSQGEYEYVPFPTSNATWHEAYSYYEGNRYEAYTITGEDTIMNDFTYKKLFFYYTAEFDPNSAKCIGGIREDENKRVYYRGEVVHYLKPSESAMGIYGGGLFGNEVLLYDFSLSVGDTLKAGNFTAPLTEYYDCGECLVVSSIDTVKVGNSYRKKFNFKLGFWCKDQTVISSRQDLEGSYFGWLEWIEGIGHGLGLIYTSTAIPTGGSSWLNCFEHNSEMLYCSRYPYPCNCFSNIISDGLIDLKEKNIKIYANQGTDKMIYFEFEDLRVDVIEIFNCEGILIEKFTVHNQPKFNFSAEKYPVGVYFYKVVTVDKREFKGKLIVK
jgi:hypothetical protein